MSVVTRSGAEEYGGASAVTLRWALKRALIGIAILFAFIAGAALLFDAAVRSDLAAAQAAAPPERVIQ